MTWSPTLFAGRRFAVVGLGRNGLPAARRLLAMGADVSVWDDMPDALASKTRRAVASGTPCAPVGVRAIVDP